MGREREREKGQLSVHRLGWLNWSKLSNYSSSSSSSDLVSQSTSRPTEFHSLWPLSVLLFFFFGFVRALEPINLFSKALSPSFFFSLCDTFSVPCSLALSTCPASLPCGSTTSATARCGQSHYSYSGNCFQLFRRRRWLQRAGQRDLLRPHRYTVHTHTGHKANTSSSSKN